MTTTTLPPNPEDYSPAKTLTLFPKPLPLLRGPIKPGPKDGPSCGPYILAFKNPETWAAAYKSSKSRITTQCEAGARIGCSISASIKCKPVWWKQFMGFSKRDFEERVKCEEVEMDKCFKVAKEKCFVVGIEKCGPAFLDARVRVSGLGFGLDRKEVFKLVSGGWIGNLGVRVLGTGGIGVTNNVRGRDLLGFDGCVSIEDYLRKNS